MNWSQTIHVLQNMINLHGYVLQLLDALTFNYNYSTMSMWSVANCSRSHEELNRVRGNNCDVTRTEKKALPGREGVIKERGWGWRAGSLMVHYIIILRLLVYAMGLLHSHLYRVYVWCSLRKSWNLDCLKILVHSDITILYTLHAVIYIHVSYYSVLCACVYYCPHAAM